jgi:protein-disulfide isomerase
VEDQIVKAYVVPGKLRFEYRHFPIIGSESLAAAEAAECAADQGKFWPYHDLLFASQSGENQGAFARPRLQSFAQQLGLDLSAFAGCLDSGTHRQAIMQQMREGQQLGVRGTPAFFLGEAGEPLTSARKIEGALPFDQFKAIIDQALAGR